MDNKTRQQVAAALCAAAEKLVASDDFNFQEGDCALLAIAMHRLSNLPLMALVDYDEEFGTVLVHAYVKINDEWRVDSTGLRTVKDMLDSFPNESAEEIVIEEKPLLKMAYGKSSVPISKVKPLANRVITRAYKELSNMASTYKIEGETYTLEELKDGTDVTNPVNERFIDNLLSLNVGDKESLEMPPWWGGFAEVERIG